MIKNLLAFIALFTLVSCRTTNSGSPQDSSIQAWNNPQALSVAKSNFGQIVLSCVPRMANYIQLGRGEKIKKFLEIAQVDKVIDTLIDRSSARRDEIDSVLKAHYEAGQKGGDDCTGPVAEYVVLEFVNQTGLLKYGFGTKGPILSKPQEL